MAGELGYQRVQPKFQVERTCNARASGARNSFSIQVLDPLVQIVRSEGAWFAMHVFSPNACFFAPCPFRPFRPVLFAPQAAVDNLDR